MVLTELLPMLATKGLDTSRVGFIGWSMGGYGALLLGGALGPARTAAICAVAPALYSDYGQAIEAGAFDGPADWFAYSVYGARLPFGDSVADRLWRQRPLLQGRETVRHLAAQAACGCVLRGWT